MNVLTPDAAALVPAVIEEQRAAIKLRSAAALASMASRSAKFNQALALLRETLRTEEQLLALLHTASSTLSHHHQSTSYLHDRILQLADLADSIEYGGAA